MMKHKILLAYFSKAGGNYFGEEIIQLDVGNTERLMRNIEDELKAELFKIERSQKYSDDYHESTKEAAKEKNANERPGLKNYLKSIDTFDVIVVAYPNWWNTMPMPVWTFLESLDFKDKVILPICTHEGSGLGVSVSDIKRLCPFADVREGLAIIGSDVDTQGQEVIQWIQERI